jgi:Protein of unknown function (DUF3631)
MTAEELLQANHISVPTIAPGRYYTTCPQCSAKRSKEHLGSKCLGVTIDEKGVRWGCNHCSWTGPEKGGGDDGERPKLKTHDYLDADGNLQFQKVRNPPGSTARFYCRRPDGNGRWINSLKGVERKPLYRWPEIVKAMEQGREIAVVEGEKDADNLWAIGIPATCNFDGAPDVSKNPKARKWKGEYSEQLGGARLIVFNDNDPQGYAHVDHICRASVKLAARVRRLDLAKHWPDIPKGGDVSDWLAAGHTGEELARLIEAAPNHAPPEGAKEDPPPASGVAAADDDDAELERLARMTPLDYERARKDAGKKLGVNRLALLDALVKAKRAELGLDGGDDKQGHAISFPEPEPWPEPVDGARLLDDLAKAIRRHVVMSDAARDEAALWVLHAHLPDCFLVSPRLAVTSPVKGCGKTTLLDVLGRLVPRPLPTANVTPAALFRVVEGYQPTLLVDEADTFLRDNDELRGVLNSGHRKGGTVLRTVGDDHEPRAFNTFCPTVISLIGTLPDTLHDRSVTIDLKRRLRTETVEPFRPDRANHLDVLARKAGRWAKDNAERIANADPKMPDGIINREADNWRPLLAIADAARGDWPERARKAAEAAHIAATADDASRLELLLGDIQTISKDKVSMPSADLVAALVAIEGRPWADGLGKNRDKPLTTNRLASMFKPLKITSEDIWHGGRALKGYVFEHFDEPFARYLSREGASEPRERENADEMGTSEPFQTARTGTDLADRKCKKSANDGHSRGLADGKGGNGQSVRSLPGDEPGLSLRTIRDLADEYRDRNYAAYQESGSTEVDHRPLDQWLRHRLAELGVFSEFIELEFERVMQAVFAI